MYKLLKKHVEICKNKKSDYNIIYTLFINQYGMRAILSRICATIVAVLLFCLWVILIPMQTKIAEKVELTYIFVDEYWNEYDIFEPIHGAATDWSFLFDDDAAETIETDIENMPSTPIQTDYLTDVVDDKREEKQALEEQQLEERLDAIDTGVDINTLIKDVDSIKQDNIEKKYENCITPWDTVLKHWESVIAYEQRKDVPTICNAQRRVCNDWVLNWTYSQWACREDVEYKFTKVKVVSYNNKTPWELIQNPWYAKNDSSEFDTRGKINPDTKIPKTDWDNSVKDWTKKDSNINLWKKTNYNCTSPWWDVVQHGQFIKAYRSPVWYTDQLCQVELRLCLDWVLNWAYTNKTCEYVWVSSQDYVEWNVDVTKPSQGLLNEVSQENPNKKWFRGRLKGRFG